MIYIKEYLNIPLKFKLHDKVYVPRICLERKELTDIKEYYITRIDISIDKRGVFINYFISTNKEKTRGKKFYNGELLFHTYDEALNYIKQEGL